VDGVDRDGALPPGADARLAAWVDAHLEEVASDVAAMLRIPSVRGDPEPDAPFGREVRRALDAFLERARRDGFAVASVPGAAGHVEWGPEGAPIVGVLAHLDVVPAGEGWTRDPFGGAREGDRIYGRGAMDDKGPAVAAYWALKAVREIYAPGARRVRLIVGGDEESGFECLHRYFAVHDMPELGFTPDASFPLVTAEKGIATLVIEAGLDGQGPTRLLSLAAGTRPNVVAARGEAVVQVAPGEREAALAALSGGDGPEGTHLSAQPEGEDRVRIVAVGRAAHASLPEQGANAAARLLLALARLPGLGEGERAVLDHLGGAGADLTGAVLGVAASDAESGPLTANLGTLSLEDGRLRAAFNLRYPVTASLDRLVARARAALPAGATAAVEGGHAPLRADPESEIVRTLERVFEAETGRPATHLAIGGGTYARELRQGVAFGPQWPEDEETAHAPDEYLSVARLARMVAIYARAIAVLAGCAPLP
jgi:succinyl-diaminopimelate desuccinylase